MTKSLASGEVFDARVCALGEGPLWHPLQQRWYWFDILNRALLAKDSFGEYVWQFDEMVSACGWLNEHALLIASESGLYRFDTKDPSATKELVVAIEADNKVTRSNDGRADPWGGFWIGTMGKQAEPGAGAIYRYYQGELRTLVANVTISNAICFAPDQSCAYYTDTPTQKIMRQALDENGWPKGQAKVFVDLSHENLNPDGAVVDSNGNLWNAQWGANQVSCYNNQGALIKRVTFDAAQISCPAFGGDNMASLVATSAAIDADAKDSKAGMTFMMKADAQGLPEYRVEL